MMKASKTLLITALITSALSAQVSKADDVTPAMPKNPPESWLTYHLAHPGPGHAVPGDPNPAFFWKGRYHLHYIYKDRAARIKREGS